MSDKSSSSLHPTTKHASLLRTLFFDKCHRAQNQKMEKERGSVKKQFESNENVKILDYDLIAVQQPNSRDTLLREELKDARQRIKGLEQELSAASRFGDLLDRHSEQELLTSPIFGLSTYHQKLQQVVEAFAIRTIGNDQPGNKSVSGLTRCSPDQIAFLRSCKPSYLEANFENILSHLINGFLYEKVCVPFSHYTRISQDELINCHIRLQATYDQAIVARWRCLTQKALRSNKKSTDTSEEDLLTELNGLITQFLVWYGIDNTKSAKFNIGSTDQKLRHAVVVLLSLIDVIHEEMVSNEYQLFMASQPALTKTFGLIAQNGRHIRVVIEAVTT